MVKSSCANGVFRGTDCSIATKRNLLGLPPFLSKEEAAILIAHIERDRGDAQTEQFGWKDMLYHLRDWKVWEFGSYVMLNVSQCSIMKVIRCSRPSRQLLLSMTSIFPSWR